MSHNNLGNVLNRANDVDGAAAEYLETIRLDPGHAEAHCNLGAVLCRQFRFAEALVRTERGHQLGSKRPDWPYPSAEWVNQCRRFIELESKLPAIITGEVAPKDVEERLVLANLCLKNQRYAASARFFTDVFTAEPGRSNDLVNGFRYNAACVACLAGTGQGRDDPKPDESARTKLRASALDWLRADLASWSGSASPSRRQAVATATGSRTSTRSRSIEFSRGNVRASVAARW